MIGCVDWSQLDFLFLLLFDGYERLLRVEF